MARSKQAVAFFQISEMRGSCGFPCRKSPPRGSSSQRETLHCGVKLDGAPIGIRRLIEHDQPVR
jgi:hypothetical protein